MAALPAILPHPTLTGPRGRTLETLIGHTPLLAFRSLTTHLPADVAIYAKAEWTNPGGSVKDRAAANIVRQAEISGAPAARKNPA